MNHPSAENVSSPVQFWIDVGGTFTDVIGRWPDGTLRRHKLLSSGVTKGCVGAGSNGSLFVDSARRQDPSYFWRGCRLHFLDEGGGVAAETVVVAFDCATG